MVISGLTFEGDLLYCYWVKVFAREVRVEIRPMSVVLALVGMAAQQNNFTRFGPSEGPTSTVVTLSTKSYNATLCRTDERHALLRFKNGLVDEADLLASWDGETSDCCKWAGILCDNITGHVHKIHLPGKCGFLNYNTIKEYKKAVRQRFREDISPSILNPIPRFIGSLGNLRYLNLSRSRFGGTISPQLGNLTELRILCLGSFYDDDTDEYEFTDIVNVKWLSSLRSLRHLDMSGVDHTKATDWFQVINTLPLLVQLHFSHSRVPEPDIHSDVASVNLTFLSFLDLSRNNFKKSYMPQWIYSITSLVSLDLSWCGLDGQIPSSIGSFHNLTSLKFLHIYGNDFMSSSLVLKGLSSIGDNLISLDMSSCGVSSVALDSLHNLTSLLSFDLYSNQLTSTLPSLESLSLESSQLSSFLPDQLGQLINLVDLQLGNNRIVGPIPYSIGRLSRLRSLDLDENLISGTIPYSIGGLLSLELLDLSNNQLTGTLPESLGQLSKLSTLDLSHNLLMGVVTDSHFSKLVELKYLNGIGNNLSLRPQDNWIPSFILQSLFLSSWDLGPAFPLWLLMQKDLELLEIQNTKISSTMPKSFWRSFPNLEYLDISKMKFKEILQFATNELVGSIPAWIGTELSNLRILNLRSNNFDGNIAQVLCYLTAIQILDFAHNNLTGNIPRCVNNFSVLSQNETSSIGQFVFLQFENIDIIGSVSLMMKGHEYTYSTILGMVMVLDLSSNNFAGSIPGELMALHALQSLNLSNNQLTGVIPKNIGDLKLLESFDVSLNHLSGELPTSLSGLSFLSSFNVSFNNLSGRIPSSTQLQSFNESSFFGNKLCGVPLTKLCGVAHNISQLEGDKSHGEDFGLIISILFGFFVGFWAIVVPVNVGAIRNLLGSPDPEDMNDLASKITRSSIKHVAEEVAKKLIQTELWLKTHMRSCTYLLWLVSQIKRTVVGMLVADTNENTKIATTKVSNKCQKIIEGEVHIGGQEHYYMEPHRTFVWTMDGGNEVHMISSTQAPQKHVAQVPGLAM
ncbi:receptor-like protein EIX1 [Bidens hawaiensis]|uniref:receptor-like protein EIX1 n=1 Tax=Bidens hawaiensis TaxID=980011 RepID=UPI00404B07FD